MYFVIIELQWHLHYNKDRLMHVDVDLYLLPYICVSSRIELNNCLLDDTCIYLPHAEKNNIQKNFAPETFY